MFIKLLLLVVVGWYVGRTLLRFLALPHHDELTKFVAFLIAVLVLTQVSMFFSALVGTLAFGSLYLLFPAYLVWLYTKAFRVWSGAPYVL